MLNDLVRCLKCLVSLFNHQDRNWKSASVKFDEIAFLLANRNNYNSYFNEMSKVLYEELNKTFTTAEKQTYPSPNIGHYVENALANIKKRL